MNRTERLLTLMNVLRRYRFPVTGKHLAEEMGISIRTLYRDIATLRGQGAQIEGEPGIGYLLRPGFFLPPLMFSQEEMEAIMLGIQWVKTYGDESLSKDSKNALTKIIDVLPKKSHENLEDFSFLRVGELPRQEMVKENLFWLRKAMREEKITNFVVKGIGKKEKNIQLWPFSLGFFSDRRTFVGWSEHQKKYVYIPTEEIKDITLLNERYPLRRAVLFKKWYKTEIKGKYRSIE